MTRFVLASWRQTRVNIDYPVELDGHYYSVSVPHALVGQKVELRSTPSAVEILARGRRIASHPRSSCKGGDSTVAEHMPAAHRAHAEWSPGRLMNWANSVGPATGELVKRLLMDKQHPEQGHRSCLGLMRLARTVGQERMEAACIRALTIGAHRYRSVASILQKALDRQPVLPSAPAEFLLPDHANVRGLGYYH